MIRIWQKSIAVLLLVCIPVLVFAGMAPSTCEESVGQSTTMSMTSHAAPCKCKTCDPKDNYSHCGLGALCNLCVVTIVATHALTPLMAFSAPVFPRSHLTFASESSEPPEDVPRSLS